MTIWWGFLLFIPHKESSEQNTKTKTSSMSLSEATMINLKSLLKWKIHSQEFRLRVPVICSVFSIRWSTSWWMEINRVKILRNTSPLKSNRIPKKKGSFSKRWTGFCGWQKQALTLASWKTLTQDFRASSGIPTVYLNSTTTSKMLEEIWRFTDVLDVYFICFSYKCQESILN